MAPPSSVASLALLAFFVLFVILVGLGVSLAADNLRLSSFDLALGHDYRADNPCVDCRDSILFRLSEIDVDLRELGPLSEGGGAHYGKQSSA